MYVTFTFLMVEWPVFQTLDEELSSNIFKYYFCIHSNSNFLIVVAGQLITDQFILACIKVLLH